MIGGHTARISSRIRPPRAGAIIAIGSCASWGGIPSADPNPTGATGAPKILEGKTVVTIPGCPANPYNFLGTALQYATFGTLPELDELARPKWAYGRHRSTRHCRTAAAFRRRTFRSRFGDEGHRKGYCLYKLGCKGPVTYANCSAAILFGDVGPEPGRSGPDTLVSAARSRRFSGRHRLPTRWTSSVRPTPTPTRRSAPPGRRSGGNGCGRPRGGRPAGCRLRRLEEAR